MEFEVMLLLYEEVIFKFTTANVQKQVYKYKNIYIFKKNIIRNSF